MFPYYVLQLKIQFQAKTISVPALVIDTDMDDLDIYEVESIIDFQAPLGWQKFMY